MENISHREDILRKIFSLLPKKLQIRFQLVSKKWRLLIKEAASDLSTTRSIDSGLVLLKHDDEWVQETKFYRFDSKGALSLEQDYSLVVPSNHRIQKIGSCNGVLFYSMKNQAAQVAEEDKHYTFHLFNPVTKRVSDLPLVPDEDQLRSWPLPVALGLALDSDTNHYKFIVVYGECSEKRKPISVAIFDSLTGKWRRKIVRFIDGISVYKFHPRWNASSVYVNRCLYWHSSISSVIVFCLKTELFRVFGLPARSRSKGVLWEADQGRIYYCQNLYDGGLCIWVLEDEAALPGKEWCQIFKVSNYETLNSMIPKSFCSNLFSATAWAFNEHLQTIYLQYEGFLVCYNIPNKTVTWVIPTISGFDAVFPFSYRAFNIPCDNIVLPQRIERGREVSVI